jgi:hypothetical protein
LAVAGAVANDRLGQTGGQGVQLGDVTGDGVFDLVVGASSADVGGVADTGAVFLWMGGAPLVGTPAASARYVVVGAVAGDGLGSF